MISYKQSYMTKQAGWISDAWGNLTNSISNGLMDVQEGVSNFFGGNDTAVGRLFAPSLDRQARVRLGFKAPTGGQPDDYFDQINKRIDQNLAHLQRADQGLEARTPAELAARDTVQRRQSAQIAQNSNAQAQRAKAIADNEKARKAMLARQNDPKAQAAFEANVNAQIAANRKALASGKRVAGVGKINGVPVANRAAKPTGQTRKI